MVKLKLTNQLYCQKVANHLDSCSIKYPISATYLAPVLGTCSDIKAAELNISINAQNKQWKIRFNNQLYSQKFTGSLATIQLTDQNDIDISDQSIQWSALNTLELIPQDTSINNISAEKFKL